MASSIFPPCDPRLIRAIREADSAAVIAHRNPDGDALYSSLAMAAVIRRLGKKAVLLNEGPFARDDIRMLEGLFSKEAAPESLGSNPLVIILDCSTPDRPGTPFAALQDLPRIVIDHHSAGIPFTEEGMSYIVPDSPSTTLLVDKVREELGVPLDKEIADFLYRGFATDTGFFHYITDRTAPESLMRVAAFTAEGVSPYDVYDEMHDGRALEDIRNTALITAASRSELGGRLITAYQGSDMKNARLSDGVYASLLTAAGVKAVVFIKDKGGALEIGFRSKNRSGIDVGAIAAELGGGGHSRAAGATITGYTPTEAREMLIERFRAVMDGTDGDSCV